jgi:hypothetical protein
MQSGLIVRHGGPGLESHEVYLLCARGTVGGAPFALRCGSYLVRDPKSEKGENFSRASKVVKP